ncbi:unnamed protein product [Ostreobium quekettii]|uniref:methionine--tRNA ligase n=1 Tax=Ostreobium quekettii TaxID=121088 RepID=A0A8S1JCC8_9CHLO|nr:unnamed protein product [Ostreobium quekettii]
MAVLSTRRGDPQSAKALVASAAAGRDIQLEFWSGPSQLRDVFSCSAKRQLVVDGEALTDANAIAEFLGGSALLPADHEFSIREWIEWEERQLRKAIYKHNRDGLAQLLDVVCMAVQGKSHIVGEQLTLADVVLFCTLLPVMDSGCVKEPLKEYLSGLEKLAAFQAAGKRILDGCPATTFAQVVEEDIATRAASSPKVPIPGQRNILITSALPYVNNVPHLGNIIGCVLSADVYARYCRARGYNAIYICGTDEYGTATETKAYEEGMTCQEVCDKYHAIHKEIYEWFDCSFDKFGRTPTRFQTEIAQDIFKSLKDNGQLIEQEMQQLFSVPLQKFLADRFVAGTCPKCGYEDARGDQCDKCSNLLNPIELIDPKCKLTGTTPIVKKTRHIFLDLPQLSDKLGKYIDKTAKEGDWSNNCLQVTNAWMRDGLKLRCITRDLKWGTPVPMDGYRDKVFYVWFDAPIGYISITADYTPDWEKWWKNPDEVELVQFMGKDNVPFHTVIFPATLIGTQQNWTMMKSISVTEYLNYENGKFSKTHGVGVFGNDARECGIPVEVWRYYLLANRPEQQDTAFVWSNLVAHNNNELLKNLGNFINRALKFVEKFFDRTIPGSTDEGQEVVSALGSELSAKVKEYLQKMEKIQMRAGLFLAMEVSAVGNKFLQDNKPWEIVEKDPERCKTLVTTGAGVAKLLAALFQPFMPSLTRRILQQLNVGWDATSLRDCDLELVSTPDKLLEAGHKINEPAPLFSKITDEAAEEFRARFSGSKNAPATSAGSNPANANGKKGKQRAKAQQKNAGASSSKESKAPGDETADGAAVAAAAGGKGKKEKKKGRGEGRAAPAKEEKPVDVSRINLRVGFINKAWQHPDADSLYVEEIDLGEEAPRQVCSGLVKFIPEEQMQKRRVVVVANLKPVTMRGIKSHAMILCATSPDGEKVELLEPPEGVPVGERVFCEGYSGEPDDVLNPKKKVFEAVQPDFATNGDRVACYNGTPFMTSKGPCTVATIVGGSIK